MAVLSKTCSRLIAGTSISNPAEVSNVRLSSLFVFCVGSGLCEESYRLCVFVCQLVCDVRTSTVRQPRRNLGCCAIQKN